MKKILVLTAMKEELQPLLDYYNPLVIENKSKIKIYQKLFNDKELFFAYTGIGKVNAAYSTLKLITLCNPDCILNFGTAGGINKNLKILDLVFADKLAYHDVDVTSFDYKLGQVPGQNLYYKTALFKYLPFIKNLEKKRELNIYQGTILSGDQFIASKEKQLQLLKIFENVYAVEMESTAIVDVCQKEQIDILVIRGISDLAYGKANIEFNEYLTKVSQKFIEIVEEFINN